MANNTHEQRIKDLEIIVKGDDEIPGIRTQLLSIKTSMNDLQKSIDALNNRLDKIIWSYVVVGTVLMFIVYFVQTVDKLPIYIKPEPFKESTKR